MIVRTDGWLDGVCRVDSPNFDARPPDSTISLIVVHAISLPPGHYGGGYVSKLFTNTLDASAHSHFAQIAGLCVSAHVLIERDGAVTQFVSFADRAWHAGTSCFEGRSACNDFSIGIELEGTDFEVFSDLQYEALNRITTALLPVYPITAMRGHSDIAPGRKTDPGPFFDWSRITRPSSVSIPSV